MITTYEAQGPRYYQEDRHWFHKSEKLMMVADGHGGQTTSQQIKEWFEDTPWPGMVNTFKQLNELTRSNRSGSTLSVVCIEDDVALVGVIGDSPVIIIDSKGDVNISPDHNVRSNKKEAEAVIARGGTIYNGYAMKGWDSGGLQMGRALGDGLLSQILSREPDIYSVTLGPDSAILLATDGVFDPAHSDTSNMEAVIRMLKARADAKEIVESIKLQDNATAIVWRPQ